MTGFARHSNNSNDASDRVGRVSQCGVKIAVSGRTTIYITVTRPRTNPTPHSLPIPGTRTLPGYVISCLLLKLSGEKFASKYNEKISEDERIMAEYNYERFKETFQEEMNKLGN